MDRSVDILIVGAGPGGIAAACSAGKYSKSVAVVDDNPAAGGQIWRGGTKRGPGQLWLQRFSESPADLIAGSKVVAFPSPGRAVVEGRDEAQVLRFKKLILAPGARELFLPFPGWTLPNVVGVGGLQALAKGGIDIAGKRIVVAGSGPLLLAAADYFRSAGAKVPVIAEQAPASEVNQFGIELLDSPGKLKQAVVLRLRLWASKYSTGTWPVAALGKEQVTAVRLRSDKREWEEPCDWLACAFGLLPNLELARLLRCATARGAVKVDDWQQTSVGGVYAVGETTGVGGADLAIAEGQIAGLAAVGRHTEAEKLIPKRLEARAFAGRLRRAFALRDEVKTLADDDTVVCRCEDVTLGQLAGRSSWREAKLQTRIGMGFCQGRVCGGATECLFGWSPESSRPPAAPARISSLMETDG
jgi:D-hydroxyproline dehydrogenase subunit alpha